MNHSLEQERDRQRDGRRERQQTEKGRKGDKHTKMEGERLRGRETDTVRQTETKMEGERLRGRETDRQRQRGRERD